MSEKRLKNEWESAAFNRETNEWDHTLLKSWEHAPDADNPFITQAAPTKITPSKAKPKTRDFRVYASIPDEQIGYRNLNGELVPMHDERAMAVARLILKEYQPDIIVKAGDTGDLGEFSRFDPDAPSNPGTVQATIDRAHAWNAELRADNPNARIVELEGNHNRLTKFVLKHAMQLAGVTRANTPEDWPVVTWPFLTRMDETDTEWVSGYPANEFWATDDLVFVHGKQVASRGSTACKMSQDHPDANVVFGHVHRQEMHTRTTRFGKFLTAITFGTLARIDGIVPSFWNGIDDRGDTVQRMENWQNGIGLIYDYGDGEYQFDSIQIHGGTANYRGKTYQVDS